MADKFKAVQLGTKKFFEEIAGYGLDEVFQGQIPDSFKKMMQEIGKREPSKPV